MRTQERIAVPKMQSALKKPEIALRTIMLKRELRRLDRNEERVLARERFVGER